MGTETVWEMVIKIIRNTFYHYSSHFIIINKIIIETKTGILWTPVWETL